MIHWSSLTHIVTRSPLRSSGLLSSSLLRLRFGLHFILSGSLPVSRLCIDHSAPSIQPDPASCPRIVNLRLKSLPSAAVAHHARHLVRFQQTHNNWTFADQLFLVAPTAATVTRTRKRALATPSRLSPRPSSRPGKATQFNAALHSSDTNLLQGPQPPWRHPS